MIGERLCLANVDTGRETAMAVKRAAYPQVRGVLTGRWMFYSGYWQLRSYAWLCGSVW